MMQDRELYKRLLGLVEPWEVTEIRVDFEQMQVDVWVCWKSEGEGICPECGKRCMLYDQRQERQWRHLDTMQFRTLLHCQIPRVKCPDHGVKSVEVPWAESNSRFTALFERLAIEILLGCQNQTKAKGLLHLSWDEVHHIQEKAVERGLSWRSLEEVKYIGVDEKSFLEGHQYVTVMSDLEKGRVLDVARDRKEESLKGMLTGMVTDEGVTIRAVAMDMWEPYMQAVKAAVPEADVVHDKFHVVKYLAEAVDKVRKVEQRNFLKEGIEDLTGTKYLWLTNPRNWSQKQKAIFQVLKGKRLKVGRAWTMKEMFAGFWKYFYEKAARNFFAKWYWWATHSRLSPMAEVAKKLKRHLENLLTYLKHRITNAVAEGLNSKIQQVKAVARGFRNFENFRIAILFYCGKLDLYPHKSQ
jgi:transposase